jgi:excisionase family DNA binding protein
VEVSIDIEGIVAREVAKQLVAEALAAAQPNEWLDSAQAARYLGVSRGRVHVLRSQGRIECNSEAGRKLYFRKSALDAYAEGARGSRSRDTAERSATGKIMVSGKRSGTA